MLKMAIILIPETATPETVQTAVKAWFLSEVIIQGGETGFGFAAECALSGEK